MKKINTTLLILLAFPLLSTTCYNTKALRKYGAKISNQTQIDFYCVPEFDLTDSNDQPYDYAFVKQRILANNNYYLLKSKQTKEMFHIPLCKTTDWNRVVRKDTLILFLYRASAVREMNELPTPLKKIFISQAQLLEQGCKINIEPFPVNP